MKQLVPVKSPVISDGEYARNTKADDRPASGRARERSGNPGMLSGRTMAPVDRLTHSGHLLLASLGRQPVIWIVLAGTANSSPVHVWPQLLAADAGDRLNVGAILSRWHPVRVGAVQPFPDMSLLDLPIWSAQ